MGLRIYALTDSHQETRNLSKILSEIYNLEKDNQEPFLVLDCGDLFKGIYNKDLSVGAYLTFKKLLPQSQIVMTLGNNDFGFDNESFEYLKSVIATFKNAGIDFVCGNLNGEKLCDEYKIITIDNTNILITGFCLHTSVAECFGLKFLASDECLNKIITDNDFDCLIVLNHHWYKYSLELKKSIPVIDLIIGGHEHSPIMPDYENNIFYPLAFAKSFFKMEYDGQIKNVEQIYPKDRIISELEKPLLKYEQETELYKPIAKRVLNLWKKYSDPCPLGTFISDNMSRVSGADIAFHSTGFSMAALRNDESDVITRYDYEKVICASTPIVKMNISVEQLKKVFENATKNRPVRNTGNARFLQCSQNISIQGKEENGVYTIVQISINGENLLDGKYEPIEPKRIFSCCVDEFISKGEQGFDLLKDIPRVLVKDDKNNVVVYLNKLLLESLKIAENIYPAKTEYPVFGLQDL